MFVTNWRAVLRRAWSIRLIVLAGALTTIEVALQLSGDILPIPAGLFAALSAFATGGAFIARIVAQKDIDT